jgi:hypothetical protein
MGNFFFSQGFQNLESNISHGFAKLQIFTLLRISFIWFYVPEVSII